MNTKKILIAILVCLLSFILFSFVVKVNAATISEDGKYSLLLTANEDEGCFDGEYAKLVRFNIEEGETTVKLSELTKGIIPFNGKTEFSHWEMAENTKASEELEIAKFTGSGYFYTTTGKEVNYTNGLTLSAKFSNKELKDTGKYYVTFDAFGGTINGKVKITLESKVAEFKTIDLTKYTPVRKGYKFTGWNAKKDGSGKNYTYIYWRRWDKDDKDDLNRDTIIKNALGAEYYQNVTLYASWTKTSGKPEQPVKETVKEIQSTGKIKGKIEFEEEVSKNYKLDIKQIEVEKDLIDKNVKYVVDINVLENGEVVKISNTKMKIRIALSEDLKGYDKYEVVYISDNEIKERIPAKIEDGYIVFETSHLSHYGVIVTNNNTEQGNEEETTNNNPKTGDNIILDVALFMISSVGIAALIYNKKKIA